MNGDEWGRAERKRAGLLTAVMLGAVLYPLRQYRIPRRQRTDGIPLSYYPMFSTRRRTHADINHVVAVALSMYCLHWGSES